MCYHLTNDSIVSILQNTSYYISKSLPHSLSLSLYLFSLSFSLSLPLSLFLSLSLSLPPSLSRSLSVSLHKPAANLGRSYLNEEQINWTGPGLATSLQFNFFVCWRSNRWLPSAPRGFLACELYERHLQIDQVKPDQAFRNDLFCSGKKKKRNDFLENILLNNS